MHPSVKKVVFSNEIERALSDWKRKDKNLFEQVTKQIEKILKEPTIGKPLRYSLKNRRRVHVGSFVLIYEIKEEELRFINFDHHDKIYER